MESNASDRWLLGVLARRPARRVATALAIVAVILGASACGSSSPSATTSSTPSGSTTPGSSTSPGSSSSSTTQASGSSALSGIEAKINSGQTATFAATYSLTATSEAGKTLTITLAHANSDSLFGVVTSSGQFKEFLVGTTSDVCVNSSGTWMCYSGAGSAEFATVIKEFEDAYGSTALAQYLKDDANIAQGTSTSTKTIAGQQVTCVSYHLTTSAAHWTYCVTSQGVIAEAEGSASAGTFAMTMTNYSTSVPSSEFTPPAKATSLP